MAQKYAIDFTNVWRWSYPTTTPWTRLIPEVDTSLLGVKKQLLMIAHSKSMELINKYKDSYQIFTDGSKIKDKVGLVMLAFTKKKMKLKVAAYQIYTPYFPPNLEQFTKL